MSITIINPEFSGLAIFLASTAAAEAQEEDHQLT
jgi:hypothetical protein